MENIIIYIINKIKTRIAIFTKALQSLDPTNEEYKKVLTEIVILKLELEQVENFNLSTIEKIFKKLEFENQEYSFINELSISDINKLVHIIRENKKNKKGDFNKIFELPVLLDDYKNELLINGINISFLKNSNELNKALEIIEKKHYQQEKYSKEFNLLFTTFDDYEYRYLKSYIENKIIPTLKEIERLKKFGHDNLLKKIIEKEEQIKEIRKEKFTPKLLKEQKIKLIEEKILMHLKNLLESIEYNIKNTYLNYKNRLGLSIDETQYEKTDDLYNLILEKLSEKDKEVKKISNKLKILYTIFKNVELNTKKEFLKLGIDQEKLKEEKKIDILDLDRDTIYEIVSRSRLYNDILVIKNINNSERKLSSI